MLQAAARIAGGEVLEGTRDFFERVALGPGGWSKLPVAVRDMALFNAPIFAAETLDPDWMKLDADALAAYPGRVLLTQGDMSPPWFPTVMEGVAELVPHAERRVVEGAGHNPHTTMPVEYAEILQCWMRQEVPLGCP